LLLWHVGGAVFLFRWIFRDPKVDLRLLAAGALLPDLLDLAIGVFAGTPTRQRLGHALISPTVAAVAVIVLTRRGRRRRALMTVVVAWLFHLLLDGVWVREETFLWPFFGDFAPWPSGSIWSRAGADPWRWVKEAAGLTYLILLWRSLGRPHPSPSGAAPGS
jgi:hypothetical protein